MLKNLQDSVKEVQGLKDVIKKTYDVSFSDSQEFLAQNENPAIERLEDLLRRRISSLIEEN
jgi:hypothetical protein